MFDVVIIGLGPAGLTASIYASRYKLSNVVIGKTLGGSFSMAHKVENWPGQKSIAGIDLVKIMEEQVKGFGAEVNYNLVSKIDKAEDHFIIHFNDDKAYEAKAIIACLGTERRKLGVPGEDAFLGKGISYCSNCDAPFFKNKKVAVVGGGDAAVTAAIHLADIAEHVYIIHRREEFRAKPSWIEKIKNNPKISLVLNNTIKTIKGEMVVKEIELENKFQDSNSIMVDGVFVEIGGIPATGLLTPLGIEFTPEGRVIVNEKMETKISGIFCAGDFTSAAVIQQALTASAQGAIAASSAFRYVRGSQTAPRILGV